MDRQGVVIQQVTIRCLPSARTVKAVKSKDTVPVSLNILLRETDTKQ